MEDHKKTQLVIAGGKGLGMFDGANIIQEWLPNTLENPYGTPSGKICLIEWNKAQFFCFSRHGDDQQHAPNDIPYLANAYALKSLGVKYWVSVSLSTALKGFPKIGDIVVPDDYLSSHIGRKDQFFSNDLISGIAYYADNYIGSVSSVLKDYLSRAADEVNIPLRMNLETDPRLIKPSDLLIFAGVAGPHTGTYADEVSLTAAFQNVVSGMTNMTEALVCKQAGIEFAAINFIGGTGMNYGSVPEAMSAYLTEKSGGIDSKIVPLLKCFVTKPLPKATGRKIDEFLGMCTMSPENREAIKNGDTSTPLRKIVSILAP